MHEAPAFKPGRLFTFLGIFFQKRFTKIDWFFFFWLFASVIPSALSEDVPHSGRTLLQLPAYVYFATRGAEMVLDLLSGLGLSKKIPIVEMLTTAIAAAVALNVSLYFIDMYRYFPDDSYLPWQGNVRTTAEYISQEKNNEYENILVSSDLMESYIFYPFYSAHNPELLQEEHVSKNNTFSYENVHVTTIHECDLLLDETMLVSEKELGVSIPWQDTVLADTYFMQENTLAYVYYTASFSGKIRDELVLSCQRKAESETPQ